MLIIPPPQRVRRGQRRETSGQNVLALFSAVYSATPSPTLTLSFDRPVNIDGYDGAVLEVDDGEAGKSYLGGAAALLSPAVVKITLVYTTSITGSGVRLTAANSQSGIIAADDAGPWTGCTNLPLPFA